MLDYHFINIDYLFLIGFFQINQLIIKDHDMIDFILNSILDSINYSWPSILQYNLTFIIIIPLFTIHLFRIHYYRNVIIIIIC